MPLYSRKLPTATIEENHCLNTLEKRKPERRYGALLVFERNRSAAGGWGFNQPTQNLVDAFDVTDPRLSCTVYGIGYNNGICMALLPVSLIGLDR